MTKLLILAANPNDKLSVNTYKEIREISRTIRSAKYGNQFDVDIWLGVTQKDLLENLEKLKPDIIHFCGHGTQSSELVVETDDGSSSSVPKEMLAKLFAKLSNYTRCVVFNACYTESQADAIAGKIEYVIGMLDKIDDTIAIKFSLAFYRQIADGSTLQEAFDYGRDTDKELQKIARLAARETTIPTSKVKFVNENLDEQSQLLDLFFDKIQEARSLETFNVLTLIFMTKNVSIKFDSKAVLTILKGKVSQWIKTAVEMNDEGMLPLIRTALKAIANISIIAHEISEGEKYFREHQRWIDNKNDSPIARKISVAVKFCDNRILGTGEIKLGSS